MKLTVQKKSTAEFEELEKAIFDNDQTFDQIYETWQSLDQFFHSASYEQDLEFGLTYFRLYVRLTWKEMLSAIDSNYFVEVIRRQISMAVLLDFDVLNQIMWYLGQNNADKNTLTSLYSKVKSAFLESEEVIGKWNGKDVKIKEIISEYVLLKNRGGSSMEEAEYVSKLKQIMFPKEAAEYILVDSDAGVERFLELVEFFQVIDNEKIWPVVDAFLNPEKYQNVEGQPAVPAPTPVPKPAAPPVQASKPSVAPPVPKPSVPVKPTSQQIKSQIESQFKKDAEGNFADVEGVMAKLGELAEKNNDQSIADMLYYDEKTAKFVWNI